MRIRLIVEQELGLLGIDGVPAYFSCERGEKYRSDKHVYILKGWAEKWKFFLNVTDVEQVNDGDRFTVTLQQTNYGPVRNLMLHLVM